MLRVLGLLLVLLVGLASAAAHAGEPSAGAANNRVVLLLPIESEGLHPSDRAALEDRLRPAFEHPQIRVITPREAVSCSDEPCLIELGLEHGASHVVRAVIVADGRDYLAQIDVLEVGDGELFDTIDASCEICGLAEFDDRLAARAVIARDWVLTTPVVGRLHVVGQPHEARVKIDGRWRGQLPYSGELGVGQHQLVVAAGGYFRQVIPIETVAGVEQRLEVELAPKPVPEWQRSVGWATLGVGLGSLTTSAILIGVHGQPATLRCNAADPADVDVDGDCRWLRRTQGVGIGLTAVGVAATAVGVSLLVIDNRRRRARERSEQAPQVGAVVGLDRIDLWIRF